MIKGRPPRLKQIFHSYDPPLYFVTLCTIHREKIGCFDGVHRAFEAYIRRARDEFDVAVGRYVTMPDHLHFFVRGGDNFNLPQARNFNLARSYQKNARYGNRAFWSHFAQ
jgi:REP element-mobilizing transposase RayT